MEKIDVSLEYKKAFYEVYMIINSLSDRQKTKVPYNFMKVIIENMEVNPDFVMDIDKKIQEQEFMPETKALLVEIYRNFLAPDYERKMWEQYDLVVNSYVEGKKKVVFDSKNNDIFSQVQNQEEKQEVASVEEKAISETNEEIEEVDNEDREDEYLTEKQLIKDRRKKYYKLIKKLFRDLFGR